MLSAAVAFLSVAHTCHTVLGSGTPAALAVVSCSLCLAVQSQILHIAVLMKSFHQYCGRNLFRKYVFTYFLGFLGISN